MPKQKDFDEALDKHLDSFLHMLKGTPADVYGTSSGVNKTEVAQAVAAVALYRSSKRLETYSKVLIGLTIALAVLTIALIVRTFH